MITYTPIDAIHLGPLPIYTHGLFMAIGIGVAYFFLRREALQKKIQPELIDNMLFAGVLSGIIGARLLYVMLNLHLYNSLFDVFKVWEGGLVSFGGLVGGIVGGLVYIWYKKALLWSIADISAPYLLLGWGIGRVGDLLAWEEIGTASSLPWAFIVNDDVPRHPAQLYSIIVLISLFIIVQFWLKLHLIRYRSVVFGISLFFYGTFRFFVEFVRDYPNSEYLFSYQQFAQMISGVIAICGLGMVILASMRARQRGSRTVQ